MWRGRNTMAVVSWTGWVLTICLLAAFFLWCWLFTPTPPEEQVQSAPAGHPDSLRQGADPVLREAVICGPNALYMLLALNGIPVDHDLIEKYMPSHAEGMSLAELKEASNALGLRTETRRCSIDELRRHFQ